MKHLKQLYKLLLLTSLILFLPACGGGGNDDPTEEDINAVSVKTYGAIGDSTTDDTQAFINAFANETSVLIPEGNYLITSALTVPSTLHIITGSGTIKGTSPNGVLILDSQGTGIKHLKINGITFQYQPTTDSKFGAIYFNDSDVKNLTIQNCHFISQSNAKWGNAIALVGKKKHKIDNIQIINNTFTNITRAAIEILVRGNDTKKSGEFPEWPAVNFDSTIVTNLSIDGNTFIHNRNTYRMPNNEIFNPAISLSGAVNGTHIKNNNINGYYWGIELDGSVNTKITDNKITTKHSALSITHGADPKVGKTIIERNTLSASEVEGTNVINTHSARNISIRKNTITGLMYLWETNNFKIEDNKFYSKQYTNIVIKDSKKCIITKNYIENTNTASNGSIRGRGHSDSSNRVTHNKIYLKKQNGVITNDTGASVVFENNELLITPQ
ncbi:MAG: right-handed parallel beta-helix repeat-containing protein [Cocleimonas sp.]